MVLSFLFQLLKRAAGVTLEDLRAVSFSICVNVGHETARRAKTVGTREGDPGS